MDDRADQASAMAVVLESMQLQRDISTGLNTTDTSKSMGIGNIHGTVDLGQVAVRHLVRRLVADTELEASRAPVDELDGALGLESGDGSVGVVGDDVATVQQAGGHILAVTGVALDHLVVRLEARHGHLLNRVGLVRRLGRRDDGGIGDKREVDARVRHQVGLEFVKVDVQRTIEAERRRDGRDD